MRTGYSHSVRTRGEYPCPYVISREEIRTRIWTDTGYPRGILGFQGGNRGRVGACPYTTRARRSGALDHPGSLVRRTGCSPMGFKYFVFPVRKCDWLSQLSFDGFDEVVGVDGAVAEVSEDFAAVEDFVEGDLVFALEGSEVEEDVGG